jgi:hypothetical protein
MTAKVLSFEDAAQVERDRKIFALRLAGVSERRIAEELKCDAKQVEAALLRMTGTVPPNLRQRTLVMELDRLDALQKAHYAAAVQGGTSATVVTLKIMEARARLMGLYAPTRTDDPLSTDVQYGSSTDQLLAELDRIAAERGAGPGPLIEGEVVKEPAPE